MTAEFTMAGALIGLALSILLIVRKMPPVYALLLGAFAGGIIGGGGLTGTVEAMVSGASDMMSSILRILTSGVLVGALTKTKSTDAIAKTIVRIFGHKRAILAVALATMVICGIGVFIPIAVIAVAPIALAVGKEAKISSFPLLLAMIGGGKAGNIISPNPNTIAVAEAFGVNLTSLMAKNIIPAIVALIVTVILSKWTTGKFKYEEIVGCSSIEEEEKLPSFFQAILGPIVVMVMLVLRPICDINIDPMLALPAGGIVCICVTGKFGELRDALTFGMSKVVSVCLILMSTGTIAGVMKASTLQDNMISLLNTISLPVFMLAPLSGGLLAAACASTTAGSTIAAQTFGTTLTGAGIPALNAGAMINASATIIDSMPHGSFFHASAGSVGMDMKERMRMLPIEALVGLSSTTTAVLMYLILR